MAESKPDWYAGIVFGPVPGEFGLCEGVAQVFVSGGFVHLTASGGGISYAVRMTAREATAFADQISTASERAVEN